MCTGAFLLARAGLLDGRRATTHWASAARLAARCTRTCASTPSRSSCATGAIWTSAGVTAGMDLALALVEEDLDRDAALTIARHLVLFLRRPGNQSQFSATLAAQQPEREPLREIQRAVLEDIAGDHRVEAMAARAHMSPRHFARAFRAETGVTPARHVERVRLEAARRRLEDSADPSPLSPPTAASAPPRRCAGSSCARSTSPRRVPPSLSRTRTHATPVPPTRARSTKEPVT